MAGSGSKAVTAAGPVKRANEMVRRLHFTTIGRIVGGRLG